MLAACLLLPAVAHADLAPPDKQLLTVNIGRFPSSLDPSKASRASDDIVANAMFAPLFRAPGARNGALVPFLASRQPAVSNGGRTYTVTLRAARWSDGVRITSADVRFAFTRARSTPLGAAAFDGVTVSTPSASTVRFHLPEARPWFDQLLASNVVTPIPSHVVRRHGDKWLLPRNIATSGPFKLLSTRGASEIVMVKNTRWWGARSVRLQKLKLLAVTESSASTLFDGMRLDATMRDTSVPRYTISRRLKDPRFRRVTTGSAQYLFLNTRVPEMSNAAVRRGIALAIDRAALVQATSSGVDRPLETIVPAGIRGVGTVAPAGGSLLAEAGTADQARARSELAAGGWPSATTFDLYYASVGVNATLAMRIADNLADVGINVTLHPLTATEFAKVGYATSPVRAEVDAVLAGWVPDYNDPQDFHQLFTCANVDAGLNPSNYCDAAGYDPLYASTTGTFASFSTRVLGHRTLEEQLTGPAGAMPAVPLYEQTGKLLVQKHVAGWIHHPSGLVDFEKVAILTR